MFNYQAFIVIVTFIGSLSIEVAVADRMPQQQMTPRAAPRMQQIRPNMMSPRMQQVNPRVNAPANRGNHPNIQRVPSSPGPHPLAVSPKNLRAPPPLASSPTVRVYKFSEPRIHRDFDHRSSQRNFVERGIDRDFRHERFENKFDRHHRHHHFFTLPLYGLPYQYTYQYQTVPVEEEPIISEEEVDTQPSHEIVPKIIKIEPQEEPEEQDEE